MRFNLRYILLTAFVISGMLYFLLNAFNDLTANFFAGFLTAFLINEIFRKSRKRAINFVRKIITRIYTNFIWLTPLPKDWQERIKNPNSNWDDFYYTVWNVKEDTLSSLQAILDRYYDLIDEELTNDVLDTIGLLDNSVTWMIADPNYDKEKKLFDIYTTIGSMTNVMDQSLNTIKTHKLIERSQHRLITFREGEPPKMTVKKQTDTYSIKRAQSLYEQRVQEWITFRDECYRQIFK